MENIWKFPLEMAGEQEISGPGLIPLTVALQHGKPHLWAIVDERAPTIDCRIVIMVTGDAGEISRLTHIGTFLTLNGSFVGHVFWDEEQSGEPE